MLYNLCNEPWLKYTLGALADRGLRPGQWTSARLREETLYLETSAWVAGAVGLRGRLLWPALDWRPSDWVGLAQATGSSRLRRQGLLPARV